MLQLTLKGLCSCVELKTSAGWQATFYYGEKMNWRLQFTLACSMIRMTKSVVSKCRGVLFHTRNVGFRGRADSSQEISVLLTLGINRDALAIPHKYTLSLVPTHTYTYTPSHPVRASHPRCGCCSPLSHRIHNNL